MGGWVGGWIVLSSSCGVWVGGWVDYLEVFNVCFGGGRGFLRFFLLTKDCRHLVLHITNDRAEELRGHLLAFGHIRGSVASNGAVGGFGWVGG